MTASTHVHEGFPDQAMVRVMRARAVAMCDMVAPLIAELNADEAQLQTGQTRISNVDSQKVVNDVAATLKCTDAPTFPGAKPEGTQLHLNFRRPATRHGCRKHPGNPGLRRGHRGAGGEEEGEEEEKGDSCRVELGTRKTVSLTVVNRF